MSERATPRADLPRRSVAPYAERAEERETALDRFLLAAGAGLNQLSVTGGERVAIDVAAALVAALVAVVVLRGQLAAVLSQARKHRRAAAMES